MNLVSVSTQTTCQDKCMTNPNKTIFSSAGTNHQIQVDLTDSYHEKYLSCIQPTDRTHMVGHLMNSIMINIMISLSVQATSLRITIVAVPHLTIDIRFTSIKFNINTYVFVDYCQCEIIANVTIVIIFF